MRTLLLLITGVLLSTTAQAGNFVEVFRKVQAGTETVDTFDAFMIRRFKGNPFGVSAFGLVTQGWAEWYVGPTFAPTDWLEVSVSVGGEQIEGDLGLRYSTAIWAGNENWNALATVELNNATFDGDDTGLWYDITTTYKLMDWLSIGIRDRRTVGAGPHFVLTQPTAKVSLWTTWAPIDPEGIAPTDPTRFLLGTQLGF